MSNKAKTVVVIGTMDTKGLELAYLAAQIKTADVEFKRKGQATR